MRRHPRFTRIASILLALAMSSLCVHGAVAKEKKRSSKKNFIPSESVGKRLLRVSEYAEEENFAEAESYLEPLTQKKRLKKYDRALVFQTYGLMLAAQEKYEPATVALETALSVDYLPDSSMQALRYNLAQLHMAKENFPRSIELLNIWMDNEENPNAQSEFLLAAAYAQTDAWDKALPHSRKAVSKSTKPVEQRLGLLLAVEFQNGNLLESLETLKLLASYFPKKRYMVQLAAAYSGLEQEDNALATLEIANLEGWLDRESEVIQLAQRYLYAELPWQAAQALQRGLEQEIVEASADNLELLANALLSAREYDAALEPLSQAAELSENGDLYVRLGQVHLQVENWPEARKALSSALEKGELKNPGNANLLLGITNFNENRLKSARTSFRAALKDEETEKSARQWLQHVDRAERERAQL
ncbi:MAG: tetratricopeptide repeat protein [Myxococcota bacterium]|nr:tetratricopeptide repeat protein [Myxococcota bacterium]